MTNKQSSETGELSDAEIEWLALRARGGFGLVITGGWAVAPEGRIWDGQACLYESKQSDQLGKLGRTIGATAALGVVQLIHGGSRATPSITHTEGISASAGAAWRPASETDIDHLIDAHVVAARRVQLAGLSGIEIHSAHGFLPAQFINRLENVRTDQWGGDLAGRSRFVRELVRAIRSATGPDFIIGVRLSVEDERHGIVLEETAAVAAGLAEDGIDYLHLSLGDAFARSVRDPTVHPIEVIRAAVPAELPIIAAGKIWTPAEASAVLQRGADMVAIGLAAIVNPDWGARMPDPDWSPIRPPQTAEQLAAAGVTEPFLAYLRDGWPGLVCD
jgi:2,4-dienoyl-CoA reductase-like NADH-dependent reductase (Old Yellow Enzyme family)